MATPITLTPTTQSLTARSTATAEQTQALLAALAGANVLTLPEGKDFADLRRLSLVFRPDASALVDVSLR